MFALVKICCESSETIDVSGKHLGIMKTKLMVYGMMRNFDMTIIPGEEKLVLDKKYTIVKVRQGKNCTLNSI